MLIMQQDNLKMQFLGGTLYVDIEIWDARTKEFKTAFLNFDTGATVTAISADVLDELGYDTSNGKSVKITTASGTATVQEVIIKKLRIGTNYTLEYVKVYAHNFPDESFMTGVIGLNVLSQFDIMLVFSSKIITFSMNAAADTETASAANKGSAGN